MCPYTQSIVIRTCAGLKIRFRLCFPFIHVPPSRNCMFHTQAYMYGMFDMLIVYIHTEVLLGHE